MINYVLLFIITSILFMIYKSTQKEIVCQNNKPDGLIVHCDSNPANPNCNIY